MELLKFLYFIIFGFCIIDSLFSGKKRLNWVLVLTALSLHAIYFFGARGVVFLAAVGIISTIAELVSLKTSINVFGVSYRYNLGDRWFSSRIVLSKVLPIEVSGAWIFLKYLSFFITSMITDQFGIGGISKAFIAALALVSFDFIIDPVAISNGTWTWKRPGIFFGVPWGNFRGWFLIGLLTSLLFLDLKLPVYPDYSMAFPVLLISAIFLTTLGKELIGRNKIMGTLANIPLFVFITLGFGTLLIH